MLKKSISSIIFSMVTILGLTSCVANKNLQIVDQTLEGTKWQLVSLHQKEITRVDKVATINFEQYRVVGNLGCNNFFGKYEVKSNSLTISQVGSTMMMCRDMSVENEYSKVLIDTKMYKIIENSLIFYNNSNVEIAKFTILNAN